MKLLMKDTTKLGIYFLLGIVILVVPLTYTLTIMANNLKNIDTYQIVLSVDKLIQNLGKIDTLNIKINNLTNTLGRINFDELEAALIAINKTLASLKVNIGPFIIQPGSSPDPASIQGQLRL